MATSSIFTNVEIKDKKNAEIFVSALEKANETPKRTPTSKVNPPLRDKKAIRALLSKRICQSFPLGFLRQDDPAPYHRRKSGAGKLGYRVMRHFSEVSAIEKGRGGGLDRPLPLP